MTLNIKEKQMAMLLHEFQLTAETVGCQMKNIRDVVAGNFDEQTNQDIESNEVILDRLELKIREEIIFAIFQFNPIASDLRQIIAYEDASTNLERIGDMLVNIAHILQRHHTIKDTVPEVREHLMSMMNIAFKMVEDAIIIFLKGEARIAYDIIEKDDQVDTLFHKLNVLLQEKYSNAKFGENDVINIINTTLISQNFERIADSATNIAESAVFIAEGKDIRHINIQNE
ncbi:MAG: hypothetical protein CSA89_00385 [Bacteroidales bacterium]|nr:MAG: hypothetical protein CSA89_00385 [Bacteroidales bacterium]